MKGQKWGRSKWSIDPRESTTDTWRDLKNRKGEFIYGSKKNRQEEERQT